MNKKRIITVFVERTNQTINLEGQFSTRRDVEEALRNHNITLNSDEIMKEGVSKIELINSDSQLPNSVIFRGRETPNLSIFILKKLKKYEGGAADRKTLMEIIKSEGRVEEFKNKYNISYTNAKTTLLEEFVGSSINNTKSVKEEETKKGGEKDYLMEVINIANEKLQKRIEHIENFLEKEYDYIPMNFSDDEENNEENDKNGYSNSDIRDMLSGLR